MTKNELMSYVGKKVNIYFKGDERGINGTLGYANEFSAKHDFRKPGYFYINNLSFKVSCVKKVEESEEEKLGIDIGDEVIGVNGRKGVVVGIVTNMGEVLLSLLMREHKVPQLVKASMYKTKTGRYFPQIKEVLEQIKKEAESEVQE